MFKRYFYLFLISFLVLGQAIAGVSVIGRKTVTGSNGRDIAGKFNESNAIEIVITLSGNQADGGSNDMSQRNIAVHVGFASNTSITIANSLEDDGLSLTKTFDDNTLTYTITNTMLTNAFGSQPDDKYFDLNIRFSNGTTDGYVDATGDGAANASDIFAVNFNCDGGGNCSNNYLFYDRTDPTLTSFTYPANNNSSFNSRSFKYTLAQNLIASGATDLNGAALTSTITIEGDNGGTGADNGASYSFNLGSGAGTEIQTGAERTVDLSSVFTPGADGSQYDIAFNMYDEAGNYYRGHYRYNVIYDITRPTILEITTSENPTTATKKLSQTVDFTVVFSEDVTADGTMTATLTSDNTAATATVTSGNIASTSSVDVEYTVATGNETGHLNITSIAMADGTFLTDDAGNQMNSFTIAGNNLSAISNFEIDGTIPTITDITSSSGDPGRFSTGETVNITVNFSEAVTMDAGNLDILLETGTPDQTVQIAANTIDGTTAVGSYEVQDGDLNTNGLTVKTISVSGGGTISDAAGNATSGYSITGDNLDDTYDFQVETTAPTIGTVTSTSNDGVYGIGATIPVVVSFVNGDGGGSENVDLNSGTLDITLATGGAGTTVSVSSISGASTATANYVVAEGESSYKYTNFWDYKNNYSSSSDGSWKSEGKYQNGYSYGYGNGYWGYNRNYNTENASQRESQYESSYKGINESSYQYEIFCSCPITHFLHSPFYQRYNFCLIF